ncbi:ATP-binding cassette, subfamily B [Ekhidna lutea]|uniref:ATP-binding cassette, subfamily B n=1 Tax=Ekhidna lutea TaxID=447679 RepID=A0A239IGG2_EKHLU|nr:ABC transporter ATP-binding protein [Ekhidna lutea]SNS92687.1 ATP-binding cassette, subfamily B [Ekhidna lutea]
MKDLGYLNKYLLKYKFHLIFGALFIIIANFFAIVPAVIVRYAFDILQRSYGIFSSFEGFELQENTIGIIGSSIIILAVLILASALLRGVFLFFMRQTIIVMSRRIEYDLKNEIFEHYQTLPLSFYRRNNTGDLMARISEDVSKVRMYIGPAIMYGINLFTLFVMVIPYMISINPTLTFYSLLPLPILSVSIYFVSNVINKRSTEIQESLSGLSTYVQEAFSGIRVIKAFVREEEVAKNFETESVEYRDRSLRLAFVQALFMPLIMALIGLSVILTVWVGSIQVFNGEVSTGNIAEFIIYVNMLTWPVTALGWITSIIQRAAASQRRINEFLDTKTDIVSKKNVEKEIEGHLVFDKVNFTYPDSGIQALKNVSFEVKPGESIAIVGTTGSGKSTIANMVCRLYDIDNGKIEIDHVAVEDYNISSLRSQIGYVPQDVFLFSDTIENNISFGNRKMSKEEIEKAAEDADLLNNIKDFKEGFQTRLGERGITLSGGQKQRVSIARAIAREPKILILDDALSAVDTKTENAILNAMQRIMQGRTSIIISHRVSSAKLADKIVMLDDGRVVEQGTHDDLLNNNGAYKELHDKQLAGEEVA